MLSRGIETDLLSQTERAGTGVIPFCPLASGLLTDKYIGGDIPAESRAAQKWGKEWVANNLNADKLAKLKSLNTLAAKRGQSLAQLALAWILRLPTITSALIGASSVEQIEENVAALDNLDFSVDELQQIDTLLK